MPMTVQHGKIKCVMSSCTHKHIMYTGYMNRMEGMKFTLSGSTYAKINGGNSHAACCNYIQQQINYITFN